MTKHKMKIGVIFTVILMSLFWLIPAENVNAIVKSNSAAKPSTCTTDQENAWAAYLNVSYDWNDDGNAVTFKSSHGKFRFKYIDTRYFSNSFSVDSDGFYTIDGKKGVVSNKNSVTLKIKNSARGNSVTVNLALSSAVGACDSMPTFIAKKAAGQTTGTFETKNFEIVVPLDTSDTTKLMEDSSHYDTLCKALRNGSNYNNKIDSKILAEYTAEGKTYYENIVPQCFNRRVLYNIKSQKKLIKAIEAALSTYKTYVDLKATGKIGYGNTDVTGNQFLINFDTVMNAAKASNHEYYAEAQGANGKDGSKFYNKTKSGSLVKDLNQAFSMSCKIKSTKNDFSDMLEHITVNGKSEYNIKANSQYYYAYDETKQTVIYKWFTKWHNKTNPDAKTEGGDKPFCTKKCEEAVEVNYGPPVASKAGLCFEYQVQVTSRVRCSTSLNGKPPQPQPYCVPVPYCNDIPGHIHQAGSNEEYDACIQKCDGGRYTSKCSNQCYEKVYKNKNVNVENAQTEKEKYSRKYSYSGYHYFSGSSIKWAGAGYANYYYYFENGRTNGDHISHGGNYVPEDGFKKRLYSTGTCNDPCKFKGCKKGKSYVNKSDYIRDYIANLEEYSSKINECKASASCTTKTATFTISTNYRNRKGTKVTIDYPYSKQKLDPEALNSADEEHKSLCEPNSSALSANTNIILGVAGCYEKCGNGLQYHTRWSFPGSWINKKTGQLSFTPKEIEGWEKKDKKFCLPLDAQDVNTKWWAYYYNNYDSSHTTSLDTATVKDKCVSLSTLSSGISDKDIEDWNISASTRKFGYYGWNFDISCFYALNSKGITAKDRSESSSEKCNTTSNYRIRTVDLKNLFPAKDVNTASSATRAPGFNWSSNAEISAEYGKNPEYQSFPTVYAEKVQSLGTSIYNDNHLEYQFDLSKATLNDMKKSDRKYGNFTGEMITQHGMYTYKSDAIRSGDFSSSVVHMIDESVIGCNNVDNYNSRSCTNITKKEEGK